MKKNALDPLHWKEIAMRMSPRMVLILMHCTVGRYTGKIRGQSADSLSVQLKNPRIFLVRSLGAYFHSVQTHFGKLILHYLPIQLPVPDVEYKI